MKVSKLWIFAVGYVVLTLVLLFLFTPHTSFSQPLSLFYKDPTITDRVHLAIINNPTGSHALLTRFFHNKVLFAANNLFISLSRSLDPNFFFSIFPNPYYGDSWNAFASPVYLPFFLLAAVTLIRRWDKVHKKYFLIPWLFGISLVIDALFVPYTAPLKLIPLFIIIQIVIFFGFYELTQQIWGKK